MSGLCRHRKIFAAIKVIQRKGLFDAQLLRFRAVLASAPFWREANSGASWSNTCLSELKAQILSQDVEREDG